MLLSFNRVHIHIVFENLPKCARFTLVVLKIFTPALYLVSVDKALGEDVFAVKDCATVLLNIEHIFMIQLEVILSVVAQIARFPDDLCGHLVSHEFLSCIQGHKRGEGRQSLPLYKFDQIELTSHGDVSFFKHLLVPRFSIAAKEGPEPALLGYE